MAGFTKIENGIFEKIITSNLTKRQLKILLFIVRFSSGCQKTYAIFKNKDFSYAGLSPSCIKNELKKLVSKRVIKWKPEKKMVWINQNLNDWSVENSVESSTRFIKIATKNLPKHQLKGHQNSKFRVNKTATTSKRNEEKNNDKQLLKENIKEILKKKKEKEFLKILKDYFLKVSPLDEEEITILRELFKKYNLRNLKMTISMVSRGNDRSFSYFQKVLNDLAKEEQSFRGEGFESLKSSLKRFFFPFSQKL